MTELGKRVQKEKVPGEGKPTKGQTTRAEGNRDAEYGNEEDLRDALSDALDEYGATERNWDEEQAYEEKPRTGDSQWRKKESTKLPIRGANGKLLQNEASESESLEEMEESDSDDESDTRKSPVQSTEEYVKGGPETVIEAKETLARLAEEIIESPEEKAHSYVRISNLRHQI